ncbi:putative reverse transcriptase [Senna tora]|uniref:Putative reverse transcriptase n=1 Tax=Senna tora TaxID=362788 RepID=A0A834WJW1_9FABA|nr:putative reverse transcriptase [Senna tora]
MQAELWGILSGLEVAWEMGLKKLIVETDSRSAQYMLKQGMDVLNLCASLVQNIHELISRDWEVLLHHNFREANKVANSLVVVGHQEPVGMRIIDEPLDCILKLLYDDVNGLGVSRSCVSKGWKGESRLRDSILVLKIIERTSFLA